MAKKRSEGKSQRSLTDNVISLFDPENLELLDALRYRRPNTSESTPASDPGSNLKFSAGEQCTADHVFAQCKIEETDETWGPGELNVKIIHRGRVRISRKEWPQVIDTCSDGFSEDAIRKDFHLNILQHPSCVRLVYISYRYKQAGDKQKEFRRGIFLDADTNIQNMMSHLAYWFTAQAHAEYNYAVFMALVDEAMTKLKNSSVL
jgi:hypothetical protein